MKFILILCLLFSYTVVSQKNTHEKLLDSIYNNLISQNGCHIEFEYIFENDNYKTKEPIIGNVTLYSNNRFHLEFNAPENHIIQIYNGDILQTLFLEEKEIHLDEITNTSGLFIQDVFVITKKNILFKKQIKKTPFN